MPFSRIFQLTIINFIDEDQPPTPSNWKLTHHFRCSFSQENTWLVSQNFFKNKKQFHTQFQTKRSKVWPLKRWTFCSLCNFIQGFYWVWYCDGNSVVSAINSLYLLNLHIDFWQWSWINFLKIVKFEESFFSFSWSCFEPVSFSIWEILAQRCYHRLPPPCQYWFLRKFSLMKKLFNSGLMPFELIKQKTSSHFWRESKLNFHHIKRKISGFSKSNIFLKNLKVLPDTKKNSVLNFWIFVKLRDEWIIVMKWREKIFFKTKKLSRTSLWMWWNHEPKEFF